jgi:hypothetical protein
MKKITIIFLFTCATTLTWAQVPFTFGPKAAANFTSFSSDADGHKYYRKTGYEAGLFFRVNITRLYIQPELLYSYRSVEAAQTNEKLHTKAIDVPVLLGFKIIDAKVFNLRAFIGPMFSFAVGENLTELYKKKPFDFSGQIGAGFDLFMFTLDFRYHYTLTKVAKTDDINLRQNALVFSLGWKFL